ncbi:DUF2986 domain-containing protein [uncultured Cocleimonas sp.]|uniref:DUF2986 domain-containing protein n=1 Tax=uncultured Cocleimonas sp. TaxID=1051587 RepID=UPI002614D878|nr:DUF2986 domain-containing protein [uncultured Cocleimonas sp.]
MNRRKKSIQIVKSRIKKAKAKLATNSKPKYVSKADRAKLAEESNQDTVIDSESES